MSREDGTASTNSAGTSPVSLEAMKRVMDEIGAKQAINGGKWMLFSPDGKVYIGEPGELIPALLADHPIFKGFPR